MRKEVLFFNEKSEIENEEKIFSLKKEIWEKKEFFFSVGCEVLH